jgi:hydroxypyruvate reductase
MISAESFMTFSLRNIPAGKSVCDILAAAIAAVDPVEGIRRAVHRKGDDLWVAGRPYHLPSFRRVAVLAVGKASLAMVTPLTEILGEDLDAALVITKHLPASSTPSSPLTVLRGNHPVPGEESLLAGQAVLSFVSALEADDLLMCFLSGGGSALMTLPVDGVTLPDLQALTSALLSGGARVDEINLLRRHLDRLKGGGLLRLSHGATVISLILSDVVGNPLEVIASGPTAPDPSTRAEALSLLGKYPLPSALASVVQETLASADETLKPGDSLLEKVQNVLIGSNLTAAQAALKAAQQVGFHPYLWRLDLQGEARQAAFELATFLRQTCQTGDPVPRPACIVVGGETTVTVKGNGRGGRNTELALAAVPELADFPGVMLVTLATDGEDGPTDAAGAVVTGDTFCRARALGLDVADFLERNDSYSFFDALGDLLRPGPTGTNVNDLAFLFAW